MAIMVTTDKYFGTKSRKRIEKKDLTPLQTAKLLKSLGVRSRDLFYEQDDHMMWMATTKLDIAAYGGDGSIYSVLWRQSRPDVASGYIRYEEPDPDDLV